jgi:hypothetical protein
MAASKLLVNSAALICGLAFSLAQPAAAGSSAEVERLLAATESSLDKAREEGNSWSSTEKLMGAAREALAAGDTDAAQELASRALLTADTAQQQTTLEQDAWQARVPTNQ